LFLESGGIRSVPRTGDVETFLQGIGQGSAKPGKSMSAKKKREALENLRRELGDCKRCKLCRERDKIVFGAGNPDADLVFVGEGPGADEDHQGEPFVGRAGQLLTKMIEAMGTTRDNVYICNIVKCRPPGNRNPEPDEIAACNPFLAGQIEIIRPKVICALGKPAAQTLLDSDEPIGRLRGSFGQYNGIKVLPTYHPAALLRNAEYKRGSWNDLQMIMAELGWGGKRSAKR